MAARHLPRKSKTSALNAIFLLAKTLSGRWDADAPAPPTLQGAGASLPGNAFGRN